MDEMRNTYNFGSRDSIPDKELTPAARDFLRVKQARDEEYARIKEQMLIAINLAEEIIEDRKNGLYATDHDTCKLIQATLAAEIFPKL